MAQQDSLVAKNDNSKIEVQEIDESHLETYKNDKAFNYVEEKQGESIIYRFKQWLGNIIRKFFEAIFGVGSATGILYFIFNILPYLLLGFLVFLLIKFFLKVNSQNIILGQQNASTIKFTEDEQIIKNENIQTLINEAIKQKNFRLAIRYSYLKSLKKLTESDIISWDHQKTNEDYIKEIQKESIKHHFKDITKIYDYVWYGEFNIDELKFESLKIAFNNLNNSLITR
ncbi:MAG: DUF4129 domain-containing protein [Bacteroidetes bacterium]|nr:DUF4129 domain-containing protein [Bacteroidota bacterium]